MASLTTINDLEALVVAIVNQSRKRMREATPIYYVKTDRDNDMLNWAPHTEIQALPLDLWRIGIIGDGNCMLHSILTALSPTYRRQNKTNRQIIADKWREVLMARAEELKDLADIFYLNIGGASAIEDSFDIIHIERDELGLDIGPLITRLYGHNFLAVQLDTGLNIKPACQTRIHYDPSLPTVVINYLGGGLDFGNVAFQESGHYEVIVRTTIMEGSSSVSLDELRTSYVMNAAELTNVLDIFTSSCGPKHKTSSGRRSTRRSSSGRRSTRRSSNKKNGAA